MQDAARRDLEREVRVRGQERILLLADRAGLRLLRGAQFLRRGRPGSRACGRSTATDAIEPDGHFTAARFQFRDPNLKFVKDRNWRWDRPPFAGTKELSGLKILIMLFSNWDNKDGRVGKGGPNTGVFRLQDGSIVLCLHRLGLGHGPVGIPARDGNQLALRRFCGTDALHL